ncbi:T9SS type A sorting domain-containing protein [candidate division TA06 bacterium]|nr:T9SS type A sorting domain-containing protein [candidate division TA06 bacterium]
MKPKSYRWLFLLVPFISGFAYGQTTCDSLYVRTLGSYPSGQSYSVKCFQNDGHDYALGIFGEGVRIINIDSVAKPKVVSALSLYNCGRITDITIQGTFAYLMGGYAGLWIVDVSDPYNPVKKGYCPLSSSSNLVAVNSQYAFAGVFYDETTGGLHIVDISDPDNPFLVTTYDSRFVGGVATKDSLVFVTFDGKLHVLNVVNPMDIKTLYIDSINTISSSGKGLLINANYLYSNTNIYDIADPANPVHYSTSDFSSGAGCYNFVIQDSALYGACGGILDLAINKIVDPVTITNLGSMDTPGWGNYLDAISEKLCMASSLSPDFNGISIYDISTPYTPQIASYITDLKSYGNSKLIARSDTVFLCGRGIEIYDAVDPNKIKLIAAFYDINRSFEDVIWDQNYIYAVDGLSGLCAYDYSSKDSLRLTDSLYLSEYYLSITASGNTVFVGADNNLKVVDISNPDSLISLGQTVFTDYVWDIEVKNDLAYIANGQQGLYIYNVANKDSLYEVGHCLTPGSACGVIINGNYAYIADYDSGLAIVDIGDAANPQVIGSLDTPGLARYVAFDTSLIYLMDDSTGIRVIDASVPVNPQEVGYYSLRYYEPGMGESYNYMKSICSGAGHIYANTLYGLQIYEYYGPNGVLANDSEFESNYCFKLIGSYPNPAVNFLSISYEITTPGTYELSIYNVLGQKISLIDKGNKVPGQYTLKWNCKDANGHKVAPGVYFYQLRDKGNNRVTKKTVVIK